MGITLFPRRDSAARRTCRNREVQAFWGDRYSRSDHTQRDTGICVADPDNSAFFPGWRDSDQTIVTQVGSRIEGIGRQRVEPSFVPESIDRMMRICDGAAIATIHFLTDLMGRRTGASTGTGVWAAFRLVSEMVAMDRRGSVVSLICDPGNRYLDKYYSDKWLADNGIDTDSYRRQLESFLDT